ncbi:MAG: twin-arginine translocase subunit TatC [Cyclobacteriaceae bacterium]|nr:twin-arginine translocase subunit TatC [Cyclobacteriaceae bacterium]
MKVGQNEMGFLDHFEELRWHLIRSLLAIGVFTILAFVYIPWIFDHIIFAPAKLDFPTFKYMCQLSEWTGIKDLCITELPFKIQSRNMTGQFMMSITASFVIGLIIAFPYIAWEFWRFIKPGLVDREIKLSRGATFFISLLFFLGVFFGYYLLSPMSVWFLSTYSISDIIVNEFDITSYVSTIASLVIGCGVLFEFPIVIFFLSKIGIVTPQLMRKYRKHSVVVILILAAVITPTADPFTLTLISLPLYLLFEISVLTSAMVMKKNLEESESLDS